MDLQIALPSRYWHDILDALETSAELKEQTSISCADCAKRIDKGRGPCALHLDAVVQAQEFYWVARQVLARLADADPVTFAPATAVIA